jgi:hypothetical protein
MRLSATEKQPKVKKEPEPKKDNDSGIYLI